MKWISEYADAGRLRFPKPEGVRILMMPFRMEDVTSTVPYRQWRPAVQELVEVSGVDEGVSYLTIDEGKVRQGATQRRPGLHVDGWGNDGTGLGCSYEAGVHGDPCFKCGKGPTYDKHQFGGLWGGGGGGMWGSKRMLMASTMYGCDVYGQEFEGEPAGYGGCEHLRGQLLEASECAPGSVYQCGPMTVHESMPAREAGTRQFVRLSLSSAGAWPESCTPNPYGVLPDGLVVKARPAEFTEYGGGR